MKVKKIKIYNNKNDKAEEIANLLKAKLIADDFIIGNDPDMVIAIGGDGAFLRMIKNENYNSDLIYVGINAGTLGFLQEIKIEEIDLLIDAIKEENYNIENVSIQETTIYSDKPYHYYSLNEIVVREKELNTCFLKISIDNRLLENYAGDGILIATSIGSTAYNLSFGGSIVSNNFHILQITPIAPLNSNVYRNLINSVITNEKSEILIEPKKDKNDLLLSIDGENKKFDNVSKIVTKVQNKKIKIFHLKRYDYWRKVNEKFLV